MVSTRRPSDSEEDMPYINFDQKPITLPLKFPVTEFVQPPDSNMHAVKNITETDVAKSSDADKGRCPANDHQPKAKAQKLSSELQPRNSDVDKFLFTLMLSSKP